MKTTILISMFLIFLATFHSCNQNKKTFYENNFDKETAVVIADTIIYDIEIKNNDPENEWAEECLQYVDRKALTKIIFKAVYDGRLIAYDYNYEIPMTIEQVKDLEKEYSRDRITKMQFIEEWFFNEEKLTFGKEVIGIMLAYELYNPEGEVKGHTAGIVVYFNKTEKANI